MGSSGGSASRVSLTVPAGPARCRGPRDPKYEPGSTGCGGGPRTSALAGQSTAAVIDAAVESLAAVLATGHAPPPSRSPALTITTGWPIRSGHFGAYSYGRVGASAARQILVEPVATHPLPRRRGSGPSRGDADPCTAHSLSGTRTAEECCSERESCGEARDSDRCVRRSCI